ncbi:PA2779 family protein [uncultured Aquabacterium sp.]|uniref:PA2779 family protein n=1 Tax=Aquabacterium sp. TaxID=1872578 RepID=UPI0025DFEAF2|nr:PA2779 family protein [uncultured Aquabacterium sp.]
MNRKMKLVAWVVAAALSHTAGLQAAHAGMIATEAVAGQVTQAEASQRRAEVLATLERADVAEALAAKGVNLDDARARVASLTDAEVAHLADTLEHAPAGAGDVLGTVVFIFLVLLVTDILGFTKVFPFTRSIR